jgi:hypothetical protein
MEGGTERRTVDARSGPVSVLDETGQTSGLECPLCFGFGAIAPDDFEAGMQAILCPLCDASGSVSPSVVMED